MNNLKYDLLIWGIVLIIVGIIIFFLINSNKQSYSSNSESAFLMIPLAGIVMIWQFFKKIK